MPEIIVVCCPSCEREFYVGPEFLTDPRAYCHCPFCAREFKPDESKRPLRRSR